METAEDRDRGQTGRFLGLDLGSETIKAVEIVRRDGQLVWCRRQLAEHGKKVAHTLTELLRDWDWLAVRGAAATGRFSSQCSLPRIPTRQAQARGFRFLFDDAPATIVSIGGRGCSVLELRQTGTEIFRESSRCSQGTGNFLEQLVRRFSMTLEEAGRLALSADRPAVLSARCPVILKSDMTHLANSGVDRARILAGLFDAVCENALAMLKPGASPERVVLIGGVSRSPKIQSVFRARLEEQGMRLVPSEGDDGLYLEALGSALSAIGYQGALPTPDNLLGASEPVRLDWFPSLADSAHRVRRLPPLPLASINGEPIRAILGLDIGSTGSKAIALEEDSRTPLWHAYRSTDGDPAGAAQALVREFVGGRAGRCHVTAIGVTGSGREIVGSLLTTCYGNEAVFVLNEIVAHAEGASHLDKRVSTIIEIGGQDAKYIRLVDGRVIDSAMNEACSAGTGSFIEEQGRKFSGTPDVTQLSSEAIGASRGVSLGQHCSVFMAEVIDQAAAAGVPRGSIIAGLYDSIIQNYLHRVKGNRPLGDVIFCQGMPFAADALAAAVARQTGCEVTVPPNPGTVGALGIALLAARNLRRPRTDALDLQRFLHARMEGRDSFHCEAAVGCGGVGNRCRISRLRMAVEGERKTFLWGGGCALYDKATHCRKLPDGAPDPFREREEILNEVITSCTRKCGRPRIAITDELVLKRLLPFFAVFLHRLGFDLEILRGGGRPDLKRGIRTANVPFCAPMAMYHGIAARLADTRSDVVFLPMMIGVPRVADEPRARTCPIVQASADILRWDLDLAPGSRIVSPVLDATGGLESPGFLASCEQLSRELGAGAEKWTDAHQAGCRAQREFDERCLRLGRAALEFCAREVVLAVVVLGRPYTIYNPSLNSNVPAILREQGSLGIPMDCLPISAEVPICREMYWAHGQRILRAAHEIRRMRGVYGIYCTNYSCGPDSFNLHFFNQIMAGKPYSIVETDGHSGDAGTRTRVEAFLHCAAQHHEAGPRHETPCQSRDGRAEQVSLSDIRGQQTRLLIPWMGPGSDTVAACIRGLDIRAESLPPPDAEAIRLGRRHTSGKECLPMAMTLGTLLQRLERAKGSDERFVYMFPGGTGPCRFGVYNLLNRIVIERLGWQKRLRLWSPNDTGYFDETPPEFQVTVSAGLLAGDLLLEALLDVEPVESLAGAAREIYDRHFAELVELLERELKKASGARRLSMEVATGRFYGIPALLSTAGRSFAEVRMATAKPTVLLAGEIYLRCVPAANGFVVEKLQRRGCRVKLAPMNEWMEYAEYLSARSKDRGGFPTWLRRRTQHRLRSSMRTAIRGRLGMQPCGSIRDHLAAARPYLRDALEGEAILTLGSSLWDWRNGQIDAAVSVGPLECMPNKIAEAQFSHIGEMEGLPVLTLSLNGDPLDSTILDDFAFEVHARFDRVGSRRRQQVV